ncbi:protein Wnt-10a-like isoform X2 [Babylonia areolata]|uniref:protein Wnt-10a-like isoform X2 n=1 Tax=Babylonia areolata TaxID=304850 RepID=UPI003FD6237B
MPPPPGMSLLGRLAPLLLLLLLLLLASPGGSMDNDILRLNIPKEPKLDPNTVCKTYPELTANQYNLCRKYPDVTASAIQGVQIAIHECQFQLRTHRWNCSSLETKNKNPHSSPLLAKGYKETAFAYAISAAGVTHQVSKACSMGKLKSCGCDMSVLYSHPHPHHQQHHPYHPRAGSRYPGHGRHQFQHHQQNQAGGQKASSSSSSAAAAEGAGGGGGGGGVGEAFEWGGCSHNVDFGERYAKRFLDYKEEARDIHSQINLHNNRAGRLAVIRNVRKQCKCHGMSGSCELRTCWKATPEFRQVGKLLKKKFEDATKIDVSNSAHGRIYKRNGKRPRKMELLYFERSPNFCDPNPLVDSPGTTGRLCNKSSKGIDNCETLCCGRGYNTLKVKRSERCHCKFYWCCYVECKVCTYNEWVTVCK